MKIYPSKVKPSSKPSRRASIDEKNHLCVQCGKGFSQRRYLTNHLNCVHKRKPRPKFTCTECNKTFTRNFSLAEHVRKVHRGIVTYYQCDICGEKFRGKLIIENHKKAVHFKKFNIHCEICGKGFLFESGLNRHKMSAHEEHEIIIPCPEEGCDKKYRTKEALKYHQNAAHAKTKTTLVCAHCGKTYTHPFLYRKHLRDHVKGPSKYPCGICQKVVTNLSSFKDHMRSHTGERPFICDQCGIGFHSKKHLRAHIVVHTKERPYACKACDKRFSQRGSLTIHKQKCHPDFGKKVC